MKQTSKISNGGNLMNRLMGNNSTTPKEGEYATILYYSDRSVVKVVQVSLDGLQAVVARCETKADLSKPCPMGHQNWIHTDTEDTYTIVYRRGAWSCVSQQVVLTTEFQKKAKANWREANTELKAAGAFNSSGELQVVKGFTRIKTVYSPISILFNSCDYYYDWSF